MSLRIPCAALAAVLLSGCATTPVTESPLEAAQRRMPAEPPLIVAEACLFQTNFFYLPHFLREESRKLAEDGSQELVVAMKARGVNVRQRTVPLMCASELPPRGEEEKGRVSERVSEQDVATLETFPVSLIAALDKDAPLKAAYAKLFEPCDDRRYRRERLYECPLLSPEQASLLKTRLKVPYVLAFSLGGEKASPASRGAGAMIGVLLGGFGISPDRAWVRVRLVSLESGGLIWSSYAPEFRGVSPSGNDFAFDGSGSGAGDTQLTDDWADRRTKGMFAKQR